MKACILFRRAYRTTLQNRVIVAGKVRRFAPLLGNWTKARGALPSSTSISFTSAHLTGDEEEERVRSVHEGISAARGIGDGCHCFGRTGH